MAVKITTKFKELLLKNINARREKQLMKQESIKNLLQDDKYGIMKFLLEGEHINTLDYKIKAIIITKDSVLSRDGNKTDFHKTLHREMLPDIDDYMSEGQHTAVGVTNMGYISINMSTFDYAYIFLPEELNDYQIQVLKEISECVNRFNESTATPYKFEAFISSPKLDGNSTNLDEVIELYTGRVRG